MTAYRYVKAPPRLIVENRPATDRRRKLINFFAKGSLLTGFIAIGSVIWPIISYELFTAPNLRPQEFLSPVVTADNSQVLGVSKGNEENLSNPKNWFPQVGYSKDRESKITHYTISIPKFDIEDAVVEIGGENLSKSLIHFPGTALPGEVGATIIFGHSILPQFFNPDNYMSIFSLIPTLQLGDEIIIKFDGIRYTYKVIDKIEVKPTNISVLEQPYDNEYLRLITCTPPGTYLRRGVITASLMD